MRLVFLGSGEFGLPTLQALCRVHEVVLVVTQPDRPAGRKRQLTPTPIALWAQESGLPIIKPEKINRPEIVEQIRAARADANVVVAFGQKIGQEVIASPRLGRAATINLHASLLPAYRGAAPINWALIRGETVTGNTVFSLVEKMDAGDILGMQSTPIDPLETAGELHDRLAEMGPALVLDVLEQLEQGAAQPQPQDESQMSIAPKLSKADGTIDFRAPAEHLRHRVHGLTPWPGVMCYIETAAGPRQPLMLRRIESLPEEQHRAPTGTMIDDGVIAVGHGAIRLLEVQPPGKRTMTWDEFQRGAHLPRGARFHGAPE